MAYDDRVDGVLEALRPFAEHLARKGYDYDRVSRAVAERRVRLEEEDGGA